jgi:type IV pilus assembly protein PilP
MSALMKRAFLNSLLAAIVAVVWLAGCGGGSDGQSEVLTDLPVAAGLKTPPPAPAPAAPASPEPVAPPSAPAGTPEASATAAAPAPAPPLYSYRSENRRDPFRSVIVAGEKLTGEELLHPLQKYAVRDLQLVAIVWGEFGTSAMLKTPDGKGYTVRKGVAVGNRQGVVKRIKPDQVIIEERYTDLFGERKEETITMDLHPSEEGYR